MRPYRLRDHDRNERALRAKEPAVDGGREPEGGEEERRHQAIRMKLVEMIAQREHERRLDRR
jgi:hypothetical protein